MNSGQQLEKKSDMVDADDSSAGLPVTLTARQQHYYLDVMGIQGWALYPPLLSAEKETALANTAAGTEENAVLSWQALKENVDVCQLCGIAGNRISGAGDINAKVMILFFAAADVSGENILSDEEAQLLRKMLKAIELNIEDVYISSLLKCRLPNTAIASATELGNCADYLKQQVALLQPEIIFVMGEQAAQALLDSKESLDVLRAGQHRFLDYPVMVSYAPADLILQPTNKKKAWADLQALQKKL